MKIVYIHGYNGTPDGPKVQALRNHFPKDEIIALQHDSVPSQVFDLLDGIASNLAFDDVIIGNSLGGFETQINPLDYKLHFLPRLKIHHSGPPSSSFSNRTSS